MPSLPNLPDITDIAKWNRILAAFPGETASEKSDAYKAWLKASLIDYVMRKEQDAATAAVATDVQSLL
jgi:hypothetical protein